MNYTETLNFLFNQLPMFQRTGKAAYKNNLDNTLKLDEHFNSPHKKFKTIHIAGTNGKGSVSHSIASVLQEKGLKVGLYTSPHLRDFRERIKINGELIPKQSVIDFVDINSDIIKKLEASFFEMTVAMAFDYFASQKVDIAIIEVGLGGRLDSTNIIKPIASLISNISLDHTSLLGNTLQAIAVEKAGVIKNNTPIIIGESNTETDSVFINKAEANNAKIYFADKQFSISRNILKDKYRELDINKGENVYIKGIELDLLGNYQTKNIISTINLIDVLRKQGHKISKENIIQGFKHIVKNTGLIGRWQTLQNTPKVICDTGHNEAGITEIVLQLKAQKYNKLHIIFGMVDDKDIEKVLSLMPKQAEYTFVKAKIPRAMDAHILQEKAGKHSLLGEVCEDIKEALEKCIANSDDDDLIFIGGSTFVVAEII